MSATQATATTEREKKQPLAPIPEWLDMSREERAVWLLENGKGYLSKEEREEKLRVFNGDVECVYLAEADLAMDADDEDTFWQWLSLVQSPAYSLVLMRDWHGADFIRGTGIDTTKADEAYGPGWLDK